MARRPVTTGEALAAALDMLLCGPLPGDPPDGAAAALYRVQRQTGCWETGGCDPSLGACHCQTLVAKEQADAEAAVPAR